MIRCFCEVGNFILRLNLALGGGEAGGGCFRWRKNLIVVVGRGTNQLISDDDESTTSKFQRLPGRTWRRQNRWNLKNAVGVCLYSPVGKNRYFQHVALTYSFCLNPTFGRNEGRSQEPEFPRTFKLVPPSFRTFILSNTASSNCLQVLEFDGEITTRTIAALRIKFCFDTTRPV